MTDFVGTPPDDEAQLSSALQADIDTWRRTVAGRKPNADCVKLLEFATRNLLETLKLEKSVHPDQAARATQAVWDVLYSLALMMDVPADIAQEAFARGRGGPDLRADSRELLPETWNTQRAGAAPAATQVRVEWPDIGKHGRPTPSCANARVAIEALGVDCRYDAFHERALISGKAIELWAGELSDHTCLMLRVRIQEAFHFDPGAANTSDGAIQLCLQGRFDPVLDYLDGLKWDNIARIDTWMSTYLGADDNALNRTIGRLTLVAAVRRARQPGCKFDQIIVLESPEGQGKSGAIEVLAGRENFSDQTILGLGDREQQEAVRGVWLYEIADLAGMHKADVDRTKAFASRLSDRARPAYGRHRLELPRRCIFIGTTNSEQYLQSHTGNRRFWPVRTGRIDLEALRRDRDQLWAEAGYVEASCASLALPEELWADAGLEQDKRRNHDPWDDLLAAVAGVTVETKEGKEERIATTDLLTIHLNLRTADKQTDAAAKRLGYCMARLGWTKAPNAIRIGEKHVRGYVRPVIAEPSEPAS
jgi:hypothetical protein